MCDACQMGFFAFSSRGCRGKDSSANEQKIRTDLILTIVIIYVMLCKDDQFENENKPFLVLYADN